MARCPHVSEGIFMGFIQLLPDARFRPNSSTNTKAMLRLGTSLPVFAILSQFRNSLLTAMKLRPFAPSDQIFFLLGSEFVDLDAHGLQLQAGHALIQFLGHAINLLFQAL